MVKLGAYVEIEKKNPGLGVIEKIVKGRVVYINQYYFVISTTLNGYRESFLFVDLNTGYIELKRSKVA